MQVYLESLGCARNQVDSEIMQAQLKAAGCTFVDHPEQADVIIVNTCSFIESAAEESIDTILALSEYKHGGRCRRLVVTGCLPQRYGVESSQAMPEVDLFLGTGAYDRIVPAVSESFTQGACVLPDPDAIIIDQAILRSPFSPYSAYLKVAEGCDRHCTYCIIPTLRGRQKSRPMDVIVQEARFLIDRGVKELTLVAQETTAYGTDLKDNADLARLLEQLARLDSLVWIRFLYGHPESLQPAVLDTMARFPNICPYFDLPIQHVSESILKAMGRRTTERELKNLFDTIRAKVPDAVLRTTVMVGFPGETEANFKQMQRFIQEMAFDHLGVFTYSDSEDLASHRLAGRVDPEVARRRLEMLMNIQQEISADNLLRYLDRHLEVLVENGPEGGIWTGRTQFQAPEVDGQTLIQVNNFDASVICGTKVIGKVLETTDYDLVVEVQPT